MKNEFDVVGIGNAIVDVLSACEEKVLSNLNLKKGTMVLIDEQAAEKLYGDMGPSTECSGGSAANTLAGIASLGGKCAFIGKVKKDQLGDIFRHDMRSVGVAFDTAAASEGPATARCLVLVTPDGERTMNTFLGACGNITDADIDEALIAKGEILYVEGYLWDQESTKKALLKGFKAARAAGKKTAFTLSDTFCVERHRVEFLELIDNHLDILFANENELLALCETLDFEAALKQIEGKAETIAITRSEKGSVILSGGKRVDVPCPPVAKVTDSTGAGDLFAAGFLYGLCRGWSPQHCAELGNRAAGHIIQQMGARSREPLSGLSKEVAKNAA